MAHLRGYFEVDNKIRLSTAKKLISERCYIEIAQGTREQNAAYCSKENNVIIFKEQKTRKQTAAEQKYAALILATQTKSRMQVAVEFPMEFVKHNGVVEKLVAGQQKCRKPWGGKLKWKNYWVAGKAGTGQSRWAAGVVSSEEQYRKNQNKWWDGCCQELAQAVIIEDMGPETMRYLVNLIKVWADRHTFTGEVKGGSMVIWPGNFSLIITSNYPIDMCVWNESDKETVQTIKMTLR
jgi:hypothetical protein